MSSVKDSVKHLMEITGLDDYGANTLLEMNNFDLEQAINYHFSKTDYMDCLLNNSADDYVQSDESRKDSKKNKIDKKKTKKNNKISPNNIIDDSDNNQLTATSEKSEITDITAEDNIRPPIPTKREQLLLPEEDQFRLQYNYKPSPIRKRRPSNMLTYCPFRDFAREAQIQEQEFNSLASYGTANLSASSSSINNNNNQNNVSGLPSSSNINLNLDNNNMNNNFDINKTLRVNNIKCNNGNSSFKRRRLEDLFRPPIDLLFWGTFQAARDHATNLNRWLIVNLQDPREFKSQVLNRDVWSDKEIKDIIISNFTLWQVSIENPEGLRFKTFYHVSECPYISIIDPRTGEERFTCDTTKPKILYDDLMKFLTENDFCLDSSLKVTKARIASSTATSNSTFIPSTSSSLTTSNAINSEKMINNIINIDDCDNNDLKLKAYKTLDLSEQDQLELAIKNSLKETQCSILNDNIKDKSDCDESNDDLSEWKSTQSNNDSSLLDNESNDFTIDSDYNNDGPLNNKSNNLNNDDIFKLGVTEQKNIYKNNKSILNSNKSSTIVSYKDLIDKDVIKTKIQIRLPDGKREDIEFPSSSQVKILKLYVCQKYPDITKNTTYKLIQSYPRKNILDLDDHITLIEADLHPTSTLYLHRDE